MAASAYLRLLLPVCAAAAGAEPAYAAAEPRVSVDVRRGPLAAALAEFARETNTELLFDPQLVARFDAPGVRGRLSRREALSRLLSRTGLGLRQEGGSFVVVGSAPQASASDAEGPALPEILVIGRRTQNADIRRTQNDIQLYKVRTSRDIDGAHRDDVEQFMRSREPANAQSVSPAQELGGVAGDTRSAIDLRGLGTLRTLVLVDGRRMPALPTLTYDHQQPDLNGIPLSAIERMETLTGTAGGIYGPSALGGVVNVILRRDYEGAFLRVSSGVTSRGDAATGALDGRLGFTLNGGDTSIMIAGGVRRSDPLRRGQRDFGERQRQLQFRNDPAGYLGQSLIQGRYRDFPTSNAISVFSADGRDLVLDPIFGGGSIGAPYSFLPVGFDGTREQAAEILRQNAGRLVFELPEDLAAGNFFLRSNPSMTSGILNIRQRLGPRAEAYFDALLFRNSGRLDASSNEILPATVANAPTNPFAQTVVFRFPRVDLRGGFSQRIETHRLSGGLLVELGNGWNAAADYSTGSATIRRLSLQKLISGNLNTPLSFGTPGPQGLPVLDPLSPYDRFSAALQAYSAFTTSDQLLKNRFQDASLRLAGPVLELPGGPLTATGLIEWRREHVPVTERRFDRPSGRTTSFVPERTQRVYSAYAELRAPLTGANGPLPVLRDLELQLALRYDDAVTRYPAGFGGAFAAPDPPTTSRRGTVTYTAGGRFRPIPALMLRGSVATGELPPTISALLSSFQTFSGKNAAYADPLRGNLPAGSERSFQILFGGLPASEPERARTITLGAVLNPVGRRWPRLSIDYSEIRKEREAYSLTLDAIFDIGSAFGRVPGVIANEAADPTRIVRAPLTNADRARGFTAGPIIQIDARGLNEGRSTIKVVDLQLDWTVPAGPAGAFRIYASASWQPTFRRRAAPREPWVETVGFADGPIEWRGNAGVDWTRGGLTLGLNAQYYGAYSPLYSAPQKQVLNPQIARFHDGEGIPAQVYLDFSARRRFNFDRPHGQLRGVEVALGIVNLLDQSPPITANVQSPGYSYYGDPRRRRFELVLSSNF